MNQKLKVLYISDPASSPTGFGQVSRRLLSSLWKTNKYDILHFAQGIFYNHPDTKRVPWLCHGTLPENQDEVNKMNQDPGYGRYVSYGGLMVDSIILNFKPDVVIWVNDPWGAGDIGVAKPWWNKIHSITWTTLDSLPIHKPFIEQLQKKQLLQTFTWSSFAEKECHTMGFHNVKTMLPPVDTHTYKIFSYTDRLKTRDKLSLTEDQFLVSYVFRNQGRKQSYTLIQALKEIEKTNPEIYQNTFLHFHTSNEEGWDHKRFCEQYQLDYGKILFTFICQECKEIEIKSDTGHKHCKFCGKENNQKTVSLGCGASVDQMVEMYNSVDCFGLVANSGATEMPGIEAMSCGVPLATIDYSYGVDFCKNDFVFKLNYTESVEFGSQFIKATPDYKDIATFIKNIYLLDKEKRIELSNQSRQWVVDNFDTEVVSQKWQSVLDVLEPHNWDFNFDSKPKFPDASIPDNIENDATFIKECYKRILDMDVADNDEGKIYWEGFLKSGRKRDEVVSFMRQVARDENAKSQQKQDEITLDKMLDNTGKKRFLLVMPESIGDIINGTALLQSLSKSYPSDKWDLYVATKMEYYDLFKGNEFVYKVIPYIPHMDSETAMTGMGNHNGFFDGFCHLFANTQKFLNYLTNDNLELELKNS